VPLNQGLFLVGMQWASASHAALLYALTPAFVVLFDSWRSRTRPEARQVLGIALAFAGVVTLLLQRGLHFDPHSVRGDVLVFLAVIAWAAYLVAGRGPTRRYGPLIVTSEALLAGTLLFLPVGVFALLRFDAQAISATGWAGLFYLAWLTSAVNYVIWFWGLEYLKPGTVAMLTNLQPVVTAVLAWLFLHESLPAGFAVSTALVLGGVWLVRGGGPGLRTGATAAGPHRG
jgi:drug/metabolite transporter (DMT)-like permease